MIGGRGHSRQPRSHPGEQIHTMYDQCQRVTQEMLPTDPQESRGYHVLVVDDHRAILWGLRKLLESAPEIVATVVTATNAAEALSALARQAFDVIILDARLGEDDGLRLMPAIREAGSAKVLVFTGATSDEIAKRAIRSGAAGVLYKADPAETLLSAIAHVGKGLMWLDWRASAELLAQTSHGPGQGAREAGEPRRCGLTRREREIISRVVRFKSGPIKAIASDMNVSAHTLRNHLTSIYDKLGLHSRLELFVYALKHGLDG